MSHQYSLYHLGTCTDVKLPSRQALTNAKFLVFFEVELHFEWWNVNTRKSPLPRLWQIDCEEKNVIRHTVDFILSGLWVSRKPSDAYQAKNQIIIICRNQPQVESVTCLHIIYAPRCSSHRPHSHVHLPSRPSTLPHVLYGVPIGQIFYCAVARRVQEGKKGKWRKDECERFDER